MNKNFLYCASLKTKDGTKWGFINEKGEFVINPHFEFASDFQKNGLATVKKDGKFGCIDKEGNFVIPPKFETIIDFSEGRAIVVFNGRFHVIDETGQILTTKGYSFISMYQHSRAMVADTVKDGNYRYGYLNKEGNVAIPLQYETASDFKDSLAVVKIKEGKFALIDKHGNIVTTFHYFYVGNYGDKLLAFKKTSNDRLGYLDMKGNVVIGPKFTVALPFENGRAVVNTAADYRNKYGLIDRKGTYVIQPVYNDMMILGENRVAVGRAVDEEKPYLGSNYAIANWNGELLTKFLYEHVSRFDQGIASVSDGEKAFFIDRSGSRARGLPAVVGADSVMLIGKLVRVMKSNRISYLNRKGKLVWKQNTIIPLTRRYRILEKKYEPNKNYVVFYPQVDGLKNAVVESVVNKKLKELSNLKKIAADEKLEYSYMGDFNVTFFKKNLLVLELYSDEYYFGAAHGMPSKNYAKINMINGCFYELKDLFKNDSDYVGRLSEIVGTMIETDPQYDYVFPGAYQGIAADQPFYVTENTLYLYFAPYEIGPYAAGFPTFEIPFSNLMDIIDTKGEFWLSFQ